jgi:beta-glucosidase
MKHRLWLLVVVVGMLLSALVPATARGESPIARATALLGQMTLAEKIGQMTLIEKNSLGSPADVTEFLLGGVLSGGDGAPATNTPEAWIAMVAGFQQAALETSLHIPIIYGIDAVHGLGHLYGATVFPHNIGLGAAGDPALVERIGRATADEMTGLGLYWNYAPVLAVVQDIRWGRTYESYGSDTALVSALGPALIRGLQANGVMATAKHFVGDGGVAWGTSTTNGYPIDQGVTSGDIDTLRLLHLPPYREAIDAGASTVMASFSSADGMKMHGNKALLTDVLRGELKFGGFVVSDWAGIDQLSGDYYQQVVTSINAGIDMNMVPTNAPRFIETLTKAVNAGDVPLARIDEAVLRILTVKFQMELFERPFADPTKVVNIGSAAHRQLAREAVAKSLVLLKNDGVLPLKKGAEILVAGRHADDLGLQAGGWTITWQGRPGPSIIGTTILSGMETFTTVKYDRFANFADSTALAEIGVAVVGEQPYAEGKGDSPTLQLDAKDIRTINKLRAKVKKLVIVVVSGRPLIMTEMIDGADAVVAAWLPGSEGAGVADGLFGVTPFTGKLPVSWPRTVDQLPIGPNPPSSGPDAPLFPFGFGLN